MSFTDLKYKYIFIFVLWNLGHKENPYVWVSWSLLCHSVIFVIHALITHFPTTRFCNTDRQELSCTSMWIQELYHELHALDRFQTDLKRKQQEEEPFNSTVPRGGVFSLSSLILLILIYWPIWDERSSDHWTPFIPYSCFCVPVNKPWLLQWYVCHICRCTTVLWEDPQLNLVCKHEGFFDKATSSTMSNYHTAIVQM